MARLERVSVWLLRYILIAIGTITWWLLAKATRVVMAFVLGALVALAALGALAGVIVLLDATGSIPSLPYSVMWVVIGPVTISGGMIAATLTTIMIVLKGVTGLRHLDRAQE